MTFRPTAHWSPLLLLLLLLVVRAAAQLSALPQTGQSFSALQTSSSSSPPRLACSLSPAAAAGASIAAICDSTSTLSSSTCLSKGCRCCCGCLVWVTILLLLSMVLSQRRCQASCGAAAAALSVRPDSSRSGSSCSGLCPGLQLLQLCLLAPGCLQETVHCGRAARGRRACCWRCCVACGTRKGRIIWQDADWGQQDGPGCCCSRGRRGSSLSRGPGCTPAAAPAASCQVDSSLGQGSPGAGRIKKAGVRVI